MEQFFECLVEQRSQVFDLKYKELNVGDIVFVVGPSNSEDVAKSLNVLVVSIDALNYRRQLTNNLYWLINGGIGSASLLAFKEICANGNSLKVPLLLGVVGLSISGICFCSIWKILIFNYYKASRSAIKVKKTLEEKLSIRTFTGHFCLNEHNDYRGLSVIESLVADTFKTAHLLMILAAVTIGIYAFAHSDQKEKFDYAIFPATYNSAN